MSEPKNSPGSPGGEHIEELLSQLKGIFGHLSESEQEEAKQKIAPPSHSASSPAPSADLPPARHVEPAAEPLPDPSSESPSGSIPDAALAAMEFEAPPVPQESATAAPPNAAGYTPNEITVPAGATLVPTAIFYPAGRVAEAKLVAEKVEKITPKFTKVAVVVNVQAMAAYDAKSDLKSVIASEINDSAIKAVFVLIEKPMDETRRKSVSGDLEPKGIYFQEIAVQQIEKKALYTDMLLGMVFFFDSRKPSGETA
jgi:hypothetical protein